MTFSPYIGVGGSVLYYSLKNAGNVKSTSYFGELTADIFFGGRMMLDDRWYATVELGQHTTSTDKFDGTIAPGSGGLFGGPLDSYTSLSLGLLYYFEPGEYSTMCDDEAGLSKFDYAKIEEIVKKYATTPANVDYNKIEDIVKKNCVVSTTKERVITSGNWVLVGVNFEFGKSSLTPESYPILVNAVQVLLSNPDMKVEIQGHTDNIGSDSFNKKLSEQRAETVKRFLVAKGVATSRLSTVGVGSSNPVADIKTAEGRSLNRRIEFKVTGK
jgi:OOP family OmpA-OmpF porin